ncbi:hypothetical protein FACS189493_7340 [Spirochaetia bacterium]|nr:hypothetical protein FACS189493_7340 [Spirochaetia bacterium]
MREQGVAILRTEAEKSGLLIDSKYRFPALETLTRLLYDGGFLVHLNRESIHDYKDERGIHVIHSASVNIAGVNMSIQLSGYAKEESSHE